jgi:hypothetical protein
MIGKLRVAPAASFTSPPAGEVGIDTLSGAIPGGGYRPGDLRVAVPPSLALPRKGGGNRAVHVAGLP